MLGALSRKFHKQTDYNFTIGKLPPNPQSWPKDFTEIEHKEYIRLPKTFLPKNYLPLERLDTLLELRYSNRNFDLGKKITILELSTILYYSAGIKPEEKNWNKIRRHYPSGGALYPLETYLFIQRVTDIKPGVYHYNVREHSLELLTDDIEDIEHLKEGLLYPWSRDASIAIFITAIWERNFKKYADRGYRITLMEAGHLAQNIALSATSLGIGCCNSVGFHNQRINEILDIEKEIEDSLYMAVLGRE